MKHLRGLALERLNLSSSPVNDQGLAHLSEIVSLRDLALAYTDVTDAGLAHLESLGALRRLDLAGTDIGDKGLPMLGRMTGLTPSCSTTRGSPTRRCPSWRASSTSRSWG